MNDEKQPRPKAGETYIPFLKISLPDNRCQEDAEAEELHRKGLADLVCLDPESETAALVWEWLDKSWEILSPAAAYRMEAQSKVLGLNRALCGKDYPYFAATMVCERGKHHSGLCGSSEGGAR